MARTTYSYPASLEPDEDGRLVVRFPALAEALTDGADEAEALSEAADCLSEALAGRIVDGEEIPAPPPLASGQYLVSPDPTIALKAALYEALRRRDMTVADLAELLDMDWHQAARLIDPKRSSKLTSLAAALDAVGCRIEIAISDEGASQCTQEPRRTLPASAAARARAAAQPVHAESKKEAERLSAQILARTTSAWNAVFIFQRVGQLGLPHATPQLALEHQRALFERFGTRQQLFERGLLDIIPKATKVYAAATFQSALDAASLIFAHSVLDSAAFDWCRVCAVARPDDLIRYIDQRRVPLSELRETSFEQLRARELTQYLEALERESLLKKMDIIFAACRPSPKFVGVRKYHYDRNRIATLDNLRHDYVHGSALGKSLPQGEDDLKYLQDTTTFLFTLVHRRYKLQLDSDEFIAYVKEHLKDKNPFKDNGD
jgi:antitoxin HicB